MERLGEWTEAGECSDDGLGISELSQVLGILEKISGCLDPEAFFAIVAEAVLSEIPVISHVSLFDRDAAGARMLAFAGDRSGSEEDGPGGPDPIGGSAVLADAGASESAHVVNETRRVTGTRTVSGHNRSACCFPIPLGAEHELLLYMEGTGERVFGKTRLAMLGILGVHLAGMVRNLRWYQEAQERCRKFQRINDICRRVFAASSLQEALDVAVRRIVEEYGYDAACVELVTEDGAHLAHRAHQARAEVRLPEGYKQRIGEGIVGRAAQQKRTICLNDTSTDPGYIALLPEIGAELCIPLLAGDALVGVLDINAREAGAFGEEDIGLLETLGRQLSLIVDKARHVDRIERTRDYLENLIGDAGDGIMVIDRERRIVRWNRGMERILGHEAGEIRGATYRDLRAPDSASGDLIGHCLAGQTLVGIEDRLQRRDGRAIHAALTLSPIREPGGEVEGVSVIVRDVSEEKRMQENLRAMHRQIRESEEKFLGLIERSVDAIFILDGASGEVIQANARAEALTLRNRGEMIGGHYLDLHPEADREPARSHFERAADVGHGDSLELRLLRRDGDPIDVAISPRVMSYGGRNVIQWLCRDISERRKAEHEKATLQLQLLQSEKLSAIGQLISGVAHELNNPLTGVIGYAQLLASRDCDEKIRRGLERVHSEAQRCHRIVQNLLTFARKHPPAKTLININDVLESTIELRSYQLRVDNIRVERRLAKDLPHTMGDFHQLQQVFMNIIMNAHTALKAAGDRGVITVGSEVADGHIRVAIADNGPGIPPDTLTKLFDPFFTTKAAGQGTGLGLSLCYGIVGEHDGKIFASSKIGQGSTLTVDLPILSGPAVIDRPEPSDAALTRRPSGMKKGRILVVDDEPSIVDVLVEALRANGHEVETAVNGRLALSRIRKGPYDAIVTDLRMPGMGGQELFEEVQRSWPALAERFLFVTGDVISRETRRFLDTIDRPWIEKPFDLREAVERVEQLLEPES